jgi:phosphoglycolate phosphatase
VNGYPAAIIWDLDGTLIDSAPDLAQALNKLLREHGHAALEEDQVRTMIGNGVAKLVERGFAAAEERLQSDRLQDLVTRFLLIYTAAATDKTRLYPGVRETLRVFADAGVQQGICTNKPEAISKQILADLSIAGYFSAVVGGDTAAEKKPSRTHYHCKLA